MKIFPQPHLYDSLQEKALLEKIERVAGKESYRPRLDELVARLGESNPPLPKTRVVIAGTNGKGQVATELAYHLHENNISHSLFLSPHILSLTERLSYNGKNSSYGELRELLDQVLTRFPEHELSFYELLFLMFLESHRRQIVEVMICEVGLGGRFDAVNAINPTVSAVVSIGRDHVKVLGHELEQILWEKLGITRPGVPCFITIGQRDLRKFCQDYCDGEGIPLWDLREHPLPKKGGCGYLAWNSHLAERLAQWVIEERGAKMVSRDLALSGICSRGRWQVEGDFIFVSAHNEDGIGALLSDGHIDQFRGIIFSFSHRERESIDQMLTLLEASGLPLYFSKKPHFKKLATTHWPSRESVRMIEGYWPISLPGPFLVLGSNYFIGEFQRALLS